MRRLLPYLAALILVLACPHVQAQATNVFNCSTFTNASSGVCSCQIAPNNSPAFWLRSNGTCGAAITVIPASPGHDSNNLNYRTTVNVQAFDTDFVFVPQGQNFSIIFNNSTNIPGYDGNEFSSGAGCEAGFFQADLAPTAPSSQNFVFAAKAADSQNSLTYANSFFTVSGVQIYESQINPCLPNQSVAAGWVYLATNEISTGPAYQQGTVGQQFSVNGDTFNAHFTYTGKSLTLQMYDVTLGNTCPGANCFAYTWQNVDIPSILGGTTSFIGLGGGTNQTTLLPNPLTLSLWTYSYLTPAATPTFSPSAGTYGSTQSVTISDATGSNYICYNFTGAPATNGIGGCAVGTLYSGAISVPKGSTIYAVAGVSESYADSAVASAAYNITGTASTPTLYFGAGTYNGNVTVTMTAAQGGVICYSTTTTPATNGTTGCTTGTHYTTPIAVSASETINAIAGGTGFTDSTVGSAAYIINPFWDGTSPSGQAPANVPTFSPLPGTYSGAQSVTLSTSATGITTPYICYTVAASAPTIMPHPDNIGGCANGTLYTGAISVASTSIVYAMAGTPAGASLPSALVQGQFQINTGTDSATGMKVSGWKSQ